MIQIFVDGASRGNPGLGACGYYITDGDKVYKEVGLHQNVTNNLMEISAIEMALKFLLSIHKNEEQIVLYSDSAWALGAAFKYWNITYNVETVMSVRKLKESFTNFRYEKVKGHSTNIGNNEIDRMLNEAMNNYKVTRNVVIKI